MDVIVVRTSIVSTLYLDAPVTRLNAADTSLPYAPTLVDEYLPNPTKIIKAVKEVMYVGA